MILQMTGEFKLHNIDYLHVYINSSFLKSAKLNTGTMHRILKKLQKCKK